MVLTSRKFEMFKDFKDFSDFLVKHNIQKPVTSIIPKNGIVIEGLGQKLAFGFMYDTDSSVCFIDLIVKNPNLKDRQSSMLVLDRLIYDIIELGKSLGKLVMCCSVGHKSLNEIALKQGFVCWNRKANLYTRSL